LGRNERKILRRSRKIKNKIMAKAKKTKKEVKIEDQSEQLQPIDDIVLSQKKYEDCEWCFQFDEDEPQVFAWTDDDLNKSEDPKVIFTITNVENSYITFQNGKTGKLFKLFARELSEEGKELRQKQKEAFKTIENASENKEAEA
jgi:hypothetical protein